MKGLVTIVGGSGFIGRYLVPKLTRRGFRVRVAVRNPNNALFLKPMGDVGQVQIVQANIRRPKSLIRALEGADAVANLAGILVQKREQTFAAIHAQGARDVAIHAIEAGARRLVQVSAIGADPSSPSRYARTKAAGEIRVREVFPGVTIIRPSVVFGPEDDFLNRFAALLRMPIPFLAMPGVSTRFQPVYVDDVAEVIAANLTGDTAASGGIAELGGPSIYSLGEILDFIMAETGHTKSIFPLPQGLGRMQGAVLQALFGMTPFPPPVTLDQVKLLARDNLVSGDYPGLAEFGIDAKSMELIAPAYLGRYRPEGQFSGQIPTE